MFCPSCGTSLESYEVFCPACGREPREASFFARRGVQVTFGVVLLAAIIYVMQIGPNQNGNTGDAEGSSSSAPRPVSKPVLFGQIAVAPLSDQHWLIEVDSTMENAHLVGSFHASGGSGNDIEAVVGQWGECENWLNGHQSRLLYVSGKVTNSSLDVPLSKAGTYCLAFSNKMALLTGKTISGDIALRYLVP
jgi:zinc-ribbon domain